MTERLHLHLSRRESQIMDALYELGEAAVEEVRRRLGGAVSYDSIRVTLRILEKKGHATHREENGRFVYRTAVPVEEAKRTVLRHVLKTFFGGSTPQAVAALADLSGVELGEEELAELAERIERAQRGRRE